MRTLFILGIALMTFLLSNSLMISPYIQDKETQKKVLKVDETEWKNLHLKIERSPVDTAKEYFERFVKNNSLTTNPSNCKNGRYFGITPTDDFGYFHLVYLEINHGKIIDIHYDELKSNGKNKRTDSDYNQEMLKSGTSPSIAYPIYEDQLVKSQDYMKVDAVTGATYSLFRFRMAVAKALGKANEN